MSELPDCTKGGVRKRQRVGIVGGGFSGVLVLAHLVEQATGPLHIDLFDPTGRPGSGLAYGTTEPSHLLNVCAERMGAWADDPGDFYRWLQSEQGQTALRQLGLPVTCAADSYVPRMFYGAYLQQILIDARHKAKRKAITVHLHQAAVTDVIPCGSHQGQQPQRLHLTAVGKGHTKRLTVDALVLATGNRPARPAFLPQPQTPGAQWVVDGWRLATDQRYPTLLADLKSDTEIVIVGTGLTMVDAVLALRDHGYTGLITAIGRHGWLPAVHAHSQPYPAWAWLAAPEQAPKTALGLLRGLRAEIAQAATLGYSWRSVIDSLRPVTQRLWQQLDEGEKRKFFRWLLPLWNVHRHRMAPSVQQELAALQQAGRLHILAGTIGQVTPTPAGLTVAYRPAGTNQLAKRHAALVINCTGPTYDLTNDQGLLQKLWRRGFVAPGPLALGVAVDSQGSAKGQVPGAIFPVGALLVGELLECTAVPELRRQTKAVADQVLQRLTLLAHEHPQVYEPAEPAGLRG